MLFITVKSKKLITDASWNAIYDRQASVRLKPYVYIPPGESVSASSCGQASLIAMVPGIVFGLGTSLLL